MYIFCFFTVAGISGTKDKGCNSLVLAGGYSDDKDLGYEFTYSGKVSKIHIKIISASLCSTCS